MALLDMLAEVRGAVPNMPQPLALKQVQRAWKKVRRDNLWSFQLYDSQWITPQIITTGLVTTVQGNTTVTVNAAAAAAINAITASFSTILQRQFRIAAGTIYNITAWNGVNQLTLDRIYAEPSATNVGYQIFQSYYAAPFIDHVRWISVRNMAWFLDLFLDKTQERINILDPQRSWYAFPTDVVYLKVNSISTSPDFQRHMYELWGVPTATMNYVLYGIREGADLVNTDDTIPSVVGEDCLIERAKWYAYQWAEANKGDLPRNQGPDFKFLMGQCNDEFKKLFTDYRRRDRETVNNWMSVRRIGWAGRRIPYYSTLSQTASTGGWYP